MAPYQKSFIAFDSDNGVMVLWAEVELQGKDERILHLIENEVY